jgi:hypothetical protein
LDGADSRKGALPSHPQEKTIIVIQPDWQALVGYAAWSPLLYLFSITLLSIKIQKNK